MYTHITFIFVLCLSLHPVRSRSHLQRKFTCFNIKPGFHWHSDSDWLTCVPAIGPSLSVWVSPAQWFRIDNAISRVEMLFLPYHIPGPADSFCLCPEFCLFSLGWNRLNAPFEASNEFNLFFVVRCTFLRFTCGTHQTSRWIMARRLWKGWLDIDIRRTLHLLRHFRFRLLVSQSRL